MVIIIKMIAVGTTRFNDDTWSENVSYRENKKHNGCIYGCPKRISAAIPVNTTVAILEMNNSNNTIVGIGLVVNYLKMDKSYNIYNDKNYNRYVYQSKFRIDKTQFRTNEESLINYLEQVVFHGKTHLKRGQGITLVPNKKIHNLTFDGVAISQFILEMFQRRFIG